MLDFFKNYDCIIIGSGVLASAIAINLIKSGFPVIMVAKESEIVLRRKLSFKDAILVGKKTIGNITASAIGEDIYHYNTPEETVYHKKLFDQILLLQKGNAFPLLSLIEFSIYKKNKIPKVVIHTLMDKEFKPDIEMADLVISLNPSAIPGINCHLYIESSFAGNLGDFYWEGIPKRKFKDEECVDKIKLLKAEFEGVFVSQVEIGETIKKNFIIGNINNKDILSPASGKIIGLRHSGEIIGKDDPVIEIDTNKESNRDKEFSLKYRYLSMAVLQGILISIKNKGF
ncbi:MAG: hypothetical protein KAR38_10085 [Calditrichia bacterium]|nr:hypothetical protein [Calditrichia bacterium]